MSLPHWSQGNPNEIALTLYLPAFPTIDFVQHYVTKRGTAVQCTGLCSQPLMLGGL